MHLAVRAPSSRPALLAAVFIVVGAVGCGGAKAPADVSPSLPAPLDANVLPELAARDRNLPLDVVAADAFDTDELASLLADAGYRGGRERELSGHAATFDHVVARTLVFGDAEGADVYLGWVREHTLDLVGRTRETPPPDLGDAAFLFELLPCTSCRKQLPTLVAAWRRGAAVGYVLASGRGVSAAAFRRLVDEVDAAVAEV